MKLTEFIPLPTPAVLSIGPNFVRRYKVYTSETAKNIQENFPCPETLVCVFNNYQNGSIIS